ncbi:uncharacterized protein DDB_G0290685-like isoform X2 [Tetranychus urticae]|uniref:uncharacterized protein DDB_G0290685-like isoform X2 n=1 Tax=Tetranychus urticae TaxID=32264 RepID=UPI00077BA388|nr:uncharacterized protein DDB_G0290685-like isoform X2 [Tetranychus urticae]
MAKLTKTFENLNNVTSTPSTVGIPKARSLTDFSSVLYEMLTSSAESAESNSEPNGVNKTKDGVMEILKGQEQAQNPYIQARGQPNRYTGNNGPTNNFGAPLGAYNPQSFSRPRNPAYGNQFQNNNNYNNNNNHNNRGFGQLSDILSGVMPDSPQRGFNTRTPQQLQQPVPNYPNNYPNLNLNHGNGNNVNIPNQGFGLGDQASNENNDQSGETDLPQSNLGEQGDHGGHGAEEPVNDEGSNEEIQPNEEEPIEGNNNDEEVNEDNNEEGGEADERVDEDGEQPEYDEDKNASTNNNDETNADTVAAADESTEQEGEQDPSNDPDLAQFQNFQGGNFPGDLFPPGILSQGDLQDIQKSIEEQQKNEAEKQRAEEEAAAQSENGDGNEGAEENAENEETNDEEEAEKPVESPPINNQLAPGYGGRVNHQPNLLGINRGLTGRSRNPGLIQPYELPNAPFANRGGLVNNNRYGSDNRGDFGTGIQDYEYERPKINRGSDVSDRAPLGFRGNLPFNRNRFQPSRESNEDEEDSENQRPLTLRDRFANRFGRFRPRLFGNSRRYNEDLGEYGGHRANSNQVADIKPAHKQDSLVDKGKAYLNQLFKRKDSQSAVDYDDED